MRVAKRTLMNIASDRAGWKGVDRIGMLRGHKPTPAYLFIHEDKLRASVKRMKEVWE